MTVVVVSHSKGPPPILSELQGFGVCFCMFFLGSLITTLSSISTRSSLYYYCLHHWVTVLIRRWGFSVRKLRYGLHKKKKKKNPKRKKKKVRQKQQIYPNTCRLGWTVLYYQV